MVDIVSPNKGLRGLSFGKASAVINSLSPNVFAIYIIYGVLMVLSNVVDTFCPTSVLWGICGGFGTWFGSLVSELCLGHSSKLESRESHRKYRHHGADHLGCCRMLRW